MSGMPATGLSTAARVWLVIAYGAGAWSPTEVRKELASENPRTIDSTLASLAIRGCLRKHEPDAEHPFPRYSVSRHCEVPPGLTVEDVCLAVGVKPKC